MALGTRPCGTGALDSHSEARESHAETLHTLVAGDLVGACDRVQHRQMEAMEVKRLAANGVDLAYVEEGIGDTVVFVHGAAGDWRTWDALRPLIAENYHYVALSRRYHHPNAWLDDGRNYSVMQHVEDVAAFIRALNVGKVHMTHQ